MALDGEDNIEEECWGLGDNFNMYARHEVKTIHYNNNTTDRSILIECIEPDSPLDINNKSHSQSQYDATGHCLWTGAFLLLLCIDEVLERIDIKGKRLIEFGCGTGVGGLAILNALPTTTPAYVRFTDNDPAALEVCERNCRLNNLHETRYSIQELTWGEKDGGTGQTKDDDVTFDFALATDVFYNVDLICPLFTTVSHSLQSGGLFILSHIPRACYNEGNPPEAVEDLEKYIIDQAIKYNLHLETIIRPPKEEKNFANEILEWCTVTSFLGGGILIFRSE